MAKAFAGPVNRTGFSGMTGEGKALRMKWMKVKTFLVLLWLLVPPVAHGLEIMQPRVFRQGMDVTGWLMSEKLDGVRGYWDGTRMLSKNGLPFHPPSAFTAALPPFAIEGEIWGGRGTFTDAVGIVKQQQSSQDWLELRFAIFDVPKAPGGFEARLGRARQWFQEHPTPYAFVIPQTPVRGEKQVYDELRRVEAAGGEGLILRRPGSPYTVGRSSDILKVKSYDDTEAVVIAHIPGKGRNKGRMGSLLVELPDSKVRFKIGTGFSDAERENPPPVGALVTFKYYGFYPSGIPKFASFLRIREP